MMGRVTRNLIAAITVIAVIAILNILRPWRRSGANGTDAFSSVPDVSYKTISGHRLKEYVSDQVKISYRYRDAGHQLWGRIIGTEGDVENAKWLETNFHRI